MRNALLRAIFVCLAISGVDPNVWGAVPESGEGSEAEKLLKKAHESTDIRAAGSQPFRLTATITLSDEHGQTKEGSYRLLWESPTKWQDEVTLPDFSQVRLANGEKLYINRKPVALSIEAFHLIHFLNFPEDMRLVMEGRPIDLKEIEKDGVREKAIKIAITDKVWWTVYLDDATPVPTRIESSTRKTRFVYQDYMIFAGHQFPRVQVVTSVNNLSIRMQVQELVAAAYKPDVFVPPPDAPFVQWCPNVTAAKPLQQSGTVMIPWPLRTGPALKKHVVVCGIIGTDGQWRNLTVVKSAGKEADAFWTSVLLHERYSPAMCGSGPVVQESVRELFMP
ncbi:MAG TPA: hypothetical protein VJX70_06475 [Candidatus Acidoferrum sp.]|nr:hypothetical protein [Candidatus Acidoferrum sp.]